MSIFSLSLSLSLSSVRFFEISYSCGFFSIIFLPSLWKSARLRCISMYNSAYWVSSDFSLNFVFFLLPLRVLSAFVRFHRGLRERIKFDGSLMEMTIEPTRLRPLGGECRRHSEPASSVFNYGAMRSNRQRNREKKRGNENRSNSLHDGAGRSAERSVGVPWPPYFIFCSNFLEIDSFFCRRRRRCCCCCC